MLLHSFNPISGNVPPYDKSKQTNGQSQDCILNKSISPMFILGDGVSNTRMPFMAIAKLTDINSQFKKIKKGTIQNKLEESINFVHNNLIFLGKQGQDNYESTVVVSFIEGNKLHFIYVGDSWLVRFKKSLLPKIISIDARNNPTDPLFTAGVKVLTEEHQTNSGALQFCIGNQKYPGDIVKQISNGGFKYPYGCETISEGDIFFTTSDGIFKQLSESLTFGGYISNPSQNLNIVWQKIAAILYGLKKQHTEENFEKCSQYAMDMANGKLVAIYDNNNVSFYPNDYQNAPKPKLSCECANFQYRIDSIGNVVAYCSNHNKQTIIALQVKKFGRYIDNNVKDDDLSALFFSIEKKMNKVFMLFLLLLLVPLYLLYNSFSNLNKPFDEFLSSINLERPEESIKKCPDEWPYFILSGYKNQFKNQFAEKFLKFLKKIHEDQNVSFENALKYKRALEFLLDIENATLQESKNEVLELLKNEKMPDSLAEWREGYFKIFFTKDDMVDVTIISDCIEKKPEILNIFPIQIDIEISSKINSIDGTIEKLKKESFRAKLEGYFSSYFQKILVNLASIYIKTKEMKEFNEFHRKWESLLEKNRSFVMNNILPNKEFSQLDSDEKDKLFCWLLMRVSIERENDDLGPILVNICE